MFGNYIQINLIDKSLAIVCFAYNTEASIDDSGYYYRFIK